MKLESRPQIMAYLDPAFNSGWVLKIAKVPLQIGFKHSEPFLAFLAIEITEPFRKIKIRINDWRKNVLY